ncbi:hypothetical protein EBS02_09050 [bacterium]|nr:hypothetical protein [bacterium]
MMIFVFAFLLVRVESYPYGLWGEWKVSQPREKTTTTKVHVYPKSSLHIHIRQDMLGGIITYQKELSGKYTSYSDLETREHKLLVRLENEVQEVDSFLGIETRLKKKSNKIRGSLCVRILDQTPDILVLSVENQIKNCVHHNNTTEFLLTRIRPSDSSHITPMNLLLIGQFVGFTTSHFYDSILYVVKIICEGIQQQ